MTAADGTSSWRSSDKFINYIYDNIVYKVYNDNDTQRQSYGTLKRLHVDKPHEKYLKHTKTNKNRIDITTSHIKY